MKELPFSKRIQLRENTYDAQEFQSIITDEHILQRQVEQYCDTRGIDYIRIPDAVYKIIFGPRSRLLARDKAFIAKYLKGIKDMIILKPLNEKYALAFIMELKTKTGKMSQGQKNKHKDLPTHIKRSFADAIKSICEFMDFEIK